MSKTKVQVQSLDYIVDKPEDHATKAWVSTLLDRAYGDAQRNKRLKVLVNPFGGTGNAPTLFSRDIQPVLAAARCKLDVERTSYRGHAIEIAEKMDTGAYDAVACCSGDGLPHEIFNGLGRRSDAAQALSKVAVTQLPCGTGNAMCLNLFGTDDPSSAALALVKSHRVPLDLTSVTQGETRMLSFLSQAVGIVAEVDLGTENYRWMGSARFTYGFFVRIMRKTVWPCEIAVKYAIESKADIKEHYKRGASDASLAFEADHNYESPSALPALEFGTVRSNLPATFTSVAGHKLGNFFAGNMALMSPGANFFPASLPSDGYLDLINIDGDIGRVAAVQCFTAVETGKFFDNDIVRCSKVTGYRIKPLSSGGGYIAIDGERIPFEEFQAEVHRGLGRTLGKQIHRYQADGVVSV